MNQCQWVLSWENEFWSSPLSFLRHTVETCNLVSTWEPTKYLMLTWGIYINVQASVLGDRLSRKCRVSTHSWRQILLSEKQRHLSYLTDEWQRDGWVRAARFLTMFYFTQESLNSWLWRVVQHNRYTDISLSHSKNVKAKWKICSPDIYVHGHACIRMHAHIYTCRKKTTRRFWGMASPLLGRKTENWRVSRHSKGGTEILGRPAESESLERDQ